MRKFRLTVPTARRARIGHWSGLLALLWLAGCQGDPAEMSFFTEGNCAQCGALIQEALAEQEGVASVDWSFETSLTTVAYYPDEIGEETMHQVLAAAGFRTGYYEPDTTARKQLPACCREPVERRLQQQLPTGH